MIALYLQDILRGGVVFVLLKGDAVPMETYVESLYVQILPGNTKEVYL